MSRLEKQIQGADRSTPEARSANRARSSDRCQVLGLQSRLCTSRPDVEYLNGAPSYGGEREARPKDLSPAFANGPVNLQQIAHARILADRTAVQLSRRKSHSPA